MSVQAITWALSVRTRSASHKAVLLVLANYADAYGDVSDVVNYVVIASQANCSVDELWGMLGEMTVDGLIDGRGALALSSSRGRAE
jgi:hypothetical protein